MQWVVQDHTDDSKVKALSQAINVSSAISNILVSRGIEDFNSAKHFFRPSLDHLHDPFLMKGMENAVSRLSEAIFNQEKVLIYGDYDVDGTTSVALCYLFLKEHLASVDFYIPDRYGEGYGVSRKGIMYAHEKGYSLVITLDCGIRAVEMTQLANDHNIDLIICDHHLPGDQLPDACAILDPKQKDCQYPYKELSGCGVGFKLLQAFCYQQTIPIKTLFSLLDLVAISIAADIVPITGENRVLAYHGLKKINHDPLPSVKSIIELAGFKETLSITNLVFGLAPRINAMGRIAHAKGAVELLVSNTSAHIDGLSSNMEYKNRERKEFDSSITAEALHMIEGSEEHMASNVTVLYKEGWHKGVIGIVASRCIEKYYRPTIILTKDDGLLTGSARSVEGYDVHAAIESCSEFLEKFGGHKYAAGLSMLEENLESFKSKFNQIVGNTLLEEMKTPKLIVDDRLSFDDINDKFVNILEQLAPFGPGNMSPVFMSEEVYVVERPRLLKEKHLKATLFQKDNSRSFDAIGFNLGQFASKLSTGQFFKIAYAVERNNFRGRQSIQLNIKDIKTT